MSENRCLLLLVCLAAVIFVAPAPKGRGPSPLWSLELTAVLASGLLAVSRRRRGFVLAIILGIPFFAAIWSNELFESDVTRPLVSVSAICYLGFMTVAMVRYALRRGRMTSDNLYGAACAYLLLGLLWSFAYLLLQGLQPGSFAPPDQGPADLLYFSYTTLTTLGYGDIQPVGRTARSLANAQAVSGVLYIAFLVARLIGMYQPVRPEHRGDLNV